MRCTSHRNPPSCSANTANYESARGPCASLNTGESSIRGFGGDRYQGDSHAPRRHPKALQRARRGFGDWQRSLKRLLILAGVPDGHAHRFRDTFSVARLLAGVPIERVSILLGHQSVRITEKHYAPWVRERQEQLEADVRRTWETPEPKRRVHGGYTEKDARVIPFKSRRKNGGGGGTVPAVEKHASY